MPQFDQQKAYAIQEQIFFDDGREEELVEFVTNHPDKASIQGSPANVLKAIDEFGRTKKYLMNVGEHKGSIVTDLIRERKPNVMVELGGYCGYSTILFSAAVRDGGGSKYYSLERSPKFAKVIGSLVAFAGLSDIVSILVGPSDKGIKMLHASGLETIDMMFLDHYKPAYTTDLKLCEHLHLIKEGTILAEEKRLKLTQERDADTASFANRHAAQYGEVEKLSTEAIGNPHLIYESKLVNSFEPTGVPDGIEITKCLGESDAAKGLVDC